MTNDLTGRLACAARRVNLGAAAAISLYFFILPGLSVLRDLADPALRSDAIPRAAWRLFEDLTPRYERWARGRIGSGKAESLALHEIAGTEWPLFGSVFYLWSVESLQEDWERRANPAGPAPREFARGAVEAATDLVLDPGHAAWVRLHWGDDYLHRENVFYRMLLISAMTSHRRLTGDARHRPMLREQVETLSAELDRSPHGILNDYPGECYPMDVLMAVAAIRRADAVLETDHSAFAARSLRGFQGARLDPRGLPPYVADPVRGVAFGAARGCGISYAFMSAPELWPDIARDWYARYEQWFWQEKYGLRGFREFPRDLGGGDWYMDVDAGPVLGGVGVSASAFGVAGSRIMGRFDRAWPLAAQMTVFGWPLPNGTWLTPRILSNAANAPLLGEACILYSLTRRAAPGMEIRTGGSLPPIVVLAWVVYFGLGFLFPAAEVHAVRRWRARGAPVRAPALQFAIWLALVLAAAALAVRFGPTAGFAALFPALLFPR
ncbi:MAG TPA: hypothetical protein P5567_13720 [Kiritimatiellia bacterium]|nr:hypothetical protein [Kiritimatiellia bacterium]HRZ13500.1 hypothetical protein [Kiritimatiellia bacterium]HSA19195.1 hypothetical protein [Kiritimatiellia bacterium]